MGIIVEDGTGVTGANSYVSEDDLDTYTDDRGTTLASGDAEAALIRATTFIDSCYRNRYPGYKTFQRLQSLEWPRTAAVDREGIPIDDDEIPIEIKKATCEAAIRELSSPQSLLPDLERGGDIRRLQAGSVAIDYGNGARAVTTFQLIDGILAGLLGSQQSALVANAIRS